MPPLVEGVQTDGTNSSYGQSCCIEDTELTFPRPHLEVFYREGSTQCKSAVY